MSPFGWFAESEPFVDPQLGTLHRRRGAWRGTIALDGGALVPLVVSGGHGAPDEEALRQARAFPADWRAQAAGALFEHLEPYAAAVAAGELEPPTGGMPKIATPADVGPHVTVEFVRTEKIDGAFVVEAGCRVAWDEEHTLGLRFRDGRLRELNGSVPGP